MKKIVLAVALLAGMTTFAVAQPVKYPAGTSAAKIAAHEAQRAKAAAFQASLKHRKDCVASQDGFVTCDPSAYVRLHWMRGTQIGNSGSI